MLNYVEVEGNEDRDFELIPDGVYDVNVTDCTATKSSKGTEGLQLEVTIDGDKFNNRKIWHTIWHTSADGRANGFMRMVKDFCLACGVQPTQFTSPAQVLGSNIKIRVFSEEGANGKMYNRIKAFIVPKAPSSPKSDTFQNDKAEDWM